MTRDEAIDTAIAIIDRYINHSPGILTTMNGNPDEGFELMFNCILTVLLERAALPLDNPLLPL